MKAGIRDYGVGIKGKAKRKEEFVAPNLATKICEKFGIMRYIVCRTVSLYSIQYVVYFNIFFLRYFFTKGTVLRYNLIGKNACWVM